MAALGLLVGACAQLPDPQNLATAAPETRLAQAGLAGADLGFQVIDLDSGAVLASRHPDKGFIPASTVKAVTAFAALETLGPGYRFATTLHAKGKLNDGVFDGDLWLKGGGDPLLSVQDLLALAGQLRDRGIREVTGRFFRDDSAVIAASAIQPRQPAAAPYNPAISALSLDFNRLHLHWQTNGAYLTPPTGTAPPVNSPADAPPGVPFTPGTNDSGPETWRIHADQLPADAGVEALPVKRPARRTAAVFRALSQRLGVTLPESRPGRAPDDARAVAALFSAPLLDTLRPALRHSNNLVSELIGRAVSRRLAGKPLDGNTSAEAVTGWLKGRLPDIDWHGLRLDNHSGLSAESRVTPRQMQAVIAAAMRTRFGGWHFAAILPAGGWDGALDGRFAAPASAGRVWAKSGTMHYAKGLCGLVFSATGKRLGFALYITDFGRRAAHERDPARLSPLKQEAARAWIERAETVMEDIVGAWIAAH